MKRKLFLMIIVVSLFTFPKMNFGQAINLGAAANFVLFTSAGAVGNTGISQITGDVGYEISGAITGFGNVNGVMHAGVDAATTAAGLALQNAIAQINSRPATIFPPSSVLGNGLIFTPGVYSIPSNATLNLDLTLDAQGNSNAEFIIKIDGTFGTSSNSKIKLINGAMACRVFWKIRDAVSMSSGTTMRGNIISGGAIQMNTGDTLEGRLFSTVGAINIDGVLAYTPTGCGSPFLTGPALPNLGSSICYTLFSSNGALVNTPPTSVIGDVGNNGIGSISGWDPSYVTGTLHLTQDISTIQCATDLSNAYSTINAMIPDIELLYPAQFGNNLVLTPHIYIMNGATTFTGSLFLNAQGNADAVFVIKIIGGAITTSTYSNVILMNGAQSKNVFWMVQGAVNINNYSIFRGTIIVPVGAINLVNTGVVLDGRALTMSGAITTAGLNATGPSCIPNITSEPTNQTACAGDSVSFSVTATGSGLIYKWRKGTVNLINTGNISGANSAILTINPVNISDIASNYNVLISGTCSPPKDSSIYVSLAVNMAPGITTAPVNRTACAGDSVSFSVAASGTGLSYHWRKGTVNLINTGNISGANTAILTINPVNITDAAANYNVVINGTCLPNAVSNNVSLVINSAPVIITAPVNKIACAGDSVSFSVAASGAGLTFHWRKGTVNLINTGNISGANSAMLTINPVNITDAAANYNVVITGTCLPNVVSNNVSLIINSATVITTAPVNQSACTGDSVSFSVAATGTGLTYHWRKGTVNLVNTGNISGANTAMLTIHPVNVTDAATDYNVVITGTCLPSAVSNNVSLIINSAPIITTGPVNKTACAGDSMSFSVVATGSGLTYHWRKDTINLINTGNISGANTAMLTINPVNVTDAATDYNVVISGTCSPTAINDSSVIDLKSAGRFGILSGVGISNNAGFSEIHNMDVGISPGVHSSITGFPPAIVVNGAIYASDDIAPPGVAAMLIQAKQDLTDAYLFLEGANSPAPATISGDQGGTTLAPGIYKSTSTLLIQSGDLTLDAQGDANAVWIFQIASALTTVGGSGGNVILSGGAQAKNVFWQVGSSATIGDGTSFKGNILALTSITMNSGSSIEGRLLARNGSVVLTSTNIINKPSGPTTNASSVISANVSLVVNTAPVITTEPTNQIVCTGSSVSFSVAATGAGLTYHWRKGIVNLINSGNISGANSAILTINPVNITDAAINYNVVITGTCLPNATSINASLIINPIPTITGTTPNSVCGSGTANLGAITSSGTIHWYAGSTGGISLGTGTSFTTPFISVTDTFYVDATIGSCTTASRIPVIASVNSLPSITGTTPNSICGSGTVNLGAITSGGTIHWYAGPTGGLSLGTGISFTTPLISVTDTFYVDATIGSCTTASRIPVIASVNSLPSITGTTPNSICGSGMVNLGAMTSGGTIHWYTGPTGGLSLGTGISFTTPFISVTDTFYVEATLGNCTAASRLPVIAMVYPTPTVNSIINLIFCNNAATSIITFSGDVAGTSYNWTNDNTSMGLGASGTGNIASFTAVNQGTVASVAIITVTPVANGCSGISNSFTITVNPTPVAVASGNSPVCTGSTINLTAQTVTGGTYLWTGPNGFSSSLQNPAINSASLTDAGNYSLSVSVNGCTSASSIVAIVVDVCPADLSVVKTVNNIHPLIGRNVIFTITATNDGPYNATGVNVTEILQSGYTYISYSATKGTYNPSTGIWTIGDLNIGISETLTITVKVNSTGNYSNTATIDGLEVDIDIANNVSTVETDPTDFFIPEGFSPNSDGINDLFVIRGIINFPDNSIIIFNRWGNKVFEASPYVNTWDGKTTMGLNVGGDQLPVGTYFYLLDLGDGSEVIKGTIYLNR